jgi:hypothetical protein
MKKTKLFIAAAFALAIGSAFAPKAAEITKKSVTAYDLNDCTQITCPNSGSIHCGYQVSGCGTQSFYTRGIPNRALAGAGPGPSASHGNSIGSHPTALTGRRRFICCSRVVETRALDIAARS